jgi:hypothetical protein
MRGPELFSFRGFAVEVVLRLAFAWIFVPLVPTRLSLPALGVLVFVPSITLPIIALAGAMGFVAGRLQQGASGALLGARRWPLALALSASIEWPLRVIALVENGDRWGVYYPPTESVVVHLSVVGFFSGLVQAIALYRRRPWAWGWAPLSAVLSGLASFVALNLGSQLSAWWWSFQKDSGHPTGALAIALAFDAIVIVVGKAIAFCGNLVAASRSDD